MLAAAPTTRLVKLNSLFDIAKEVRLLFSMNLQVFVERMVSGYTNMES